MNSGNFMSSIPGTPQYMSPEQAQGRSDRLGPRTDVYSLGAMLYHLLVGRPPRFDAKSAEEAWQQARSGIFAPPQSIRSDVDRDLKAVCLKAMAYEADDRYLSADEFRQDLERWLAGQNVTARPRDPVSVRRTAELVNSTSPLATSRNFRSVAIGSRIR